MSELKIYHSYSPEETFKIGKKLGEKALVNTVFCFFGDLGAGKTTFIKGFVSGVNKSPLDQVISPTFNYLNIYEGEPKELTVYHFDLYRLPNEEEFFAMGFHEVFEAEGVCCIEWSERIQSFLPDHYMVVKMVHKTNSHREIHIKE